MGKPWIRDLFREKLRRPCDEHMIALVITHPTTDQGKHFLRARLLQFTAHLISKSFCLLLAVDMHGEAAHIVQELRHEPFLHRLSAQVIDQASSEVDVLQGLKNLTA